MTNGERLYRRLNKKKNLRDFIAYSSPCDYCISQGFCDQNVADARDCERGITIWMQTEEK